MRNQHEPFYMSVTTQKFDPKKQCNTYAAGCHSQAASGRAFETCNHYSYDKPVVFDSTLHLGNETELVVKDKSLDTILKELTNSMQQKVDEAESTFNRMELAMHSRMNQAKEDATAAKKSAVEANASAKAAATNAARQIKNAQQKAKEDTETAKQETAAVTKQLIQAQEDLLNVQNKLVTANQRAAACTQKTDISR